MGKLHTLNCYVVLNVLRPCSAQFADVVGALNVTQTKHPNGDDYCAVGLTHATIALLIVVGTLASCPRVGAQLDALAEQGVDTALALQALRKALRKALLPQEGEGGGKKAKGAETAAADCSLADVTQFITAFLPTAGRVSPATWTPPMQAGLIEFVGVLSGHIERVDKGNKNVNIVGLLYNLTREAGNRTLRAFSTMLETVFTAPHFQRTFHNGPPAVASIYAHAPLVMGATFATVYDFVANLQPQGQTDSPLLTVARQFDFTTQQLSVYAAAHVGMAQQSYAVAEQVKRVYACYPNKNGAVRGGIDLNAEPLKAIGVLADAVAVRLLSYFLT